MIKKLSVFLHNHFPFLMIKFYILIGKIDLTYADELRSLKQLLDKVPLSDPKVFIDIGCGDGFNMSSAYYLSLNGWQGLLIDSDSHSISIAKKLYKKNPRILVTREFVSIVNIENLLKFNGISKISYLKIDIDSIDALILEAILINKNINNPEIISIEINEKIPLDIEFTMTKIDSNFKSNALFYGCSFSYVCRLAKSFGYVPYLLAFNNLFLVKSNLLNEDQLLKLQNTEEIFRNGYLYNINKPHFFPWNDQYDYWHTLKPEIAIRLIQKKLAEYNLENYFLLKLRD